MKRINETGKGKQHAQCYTCGKIIPNGEYGIDAQDFKHCYECCGKRDLKDMKETGEITLYLSFDFPEYMIGWPYSKICKPRKYQIVLNGKVSNWPGSLSFPVKMVNIGRHNLAGVRYDFWFWADGEHWHGVRYGDNTQIAHCKRIKR